MGFSGNVSRNGLLPSPGPLTRIVEGGDRCGAAAVAGVTLRGAGFLGPPRIGPTALEGPTSSSLLAPEELSESMRDRPVAAEDGPVGLTRVVASAGRALRD